VEWKPGVQVPAQHYLHAYDNWEKWAAYYWTIRNIIDLGANRVLEVGVGSKVVSTYLQRNGIRLTTLDIDPALEPDVTGTVTDMPFQTGAFDAVACTEVLEHMPFEKSCRAISELHRVTRGFALVAVPHFTFSFALLLRLPVIQLREFRLRIPYPKRMGKSVEHYWECGRRGYPVSRLRAEFQRAGFRIVSEERPMTNYSSCFFVLRKEI
jgi:hypothetical protein